MQKLTEKHCEQATRLPLLLKMNTYANQLLMNEVEVCYWHTLNMSRTSIWNEKPNIVIEKLLVYALFAKMNSSSVENAEIFKTFIMHNYRDILKIHWREFSGFPECDQNNWVRFVNN
jgi:hypothetical protein